jgi:hypothetical protein
MPEFTAHIVRRVLAINGLDRLVSIYRHWKRPRPSGRQHRYSPW